MTTSTHTQRRAQRLDDPRFERLRTTAARRRLVVALSALLVAEAGLFLVMEEAPIAGAAALAVLLVVFVLLLGMLKASTRGVEELPADALDERQWQLRGEAYALSYRIGFALLVAELVVVAVWHAAGWAAPGNGLATAAVLLPFHVGIVLPSMVTAWSREV